MPGGGDAAGQQPSRSCASPPPPESPLWLPSLAQPRSGRASPGSLLRTNPAQLYKLDTLAAQPLGPGPRSGSPDGCSSSSKGGRLPSIHASAVHKPCARRSPEPSEQQCLAKHARIAAAAAESSSQAATAAAARAAAPPPPAAAAAAMEWDARLTISSTGATTSSQQHRHAAPASCLPQLLPEGAGSGTEHCGGDSSSSSSWDPGAAASVAAAGAVVLEQPDDVDAAAAASTSAAAAAEAEPCISPDGSSVRTGEDVEAFYGKYGQDSAVKFFYCIRPPEGPRYRPYDLLVVTREAAARAPEYFTVSANGVVAIRGGQQAEFVALASWVRQRSLFDLVSQIGFYKHFLTGRAFRRWHKGVRQRNFKRVRAQLAARLFAARPTFAGALREVQAAVSALQHVSFASASANHMYSLAEYGELQVATREHKAKPALDGVVDKIQQVLERLCREVQAQAVLYQESVRDASELEDTTGVELFQGGTAGRARPMVVIKQEKLQRAANYARVMEELAQLGAFVRLADCLLVEGVVGCALASVEQLLALLTAHKQQSDKQAKALFQVVVSFEARGMAFSPNEAAVLEELNANTLEGIIAVAQGAPRVLFMRAFAHLFDSVPSGLNALSILRASGQLTALRAAINQAVLDDYAAARDAVRELDTSYRRVWEFARAWDGDAYAAQPRILGEIRRDLVLQRNWKGALERMKTNMAVGCLQIDAKPLRAELAPVIASALERIKLLLLTMARQATLAVLDDITARIQMLSVRPTQLDDFVGYMNLHTQQLDDRKLLSSQVGQVEDMYESLAAHEQKVPTADQVKHDDLTEAMAAFQSQLTQGLEFIADHKEEQCGVLLANVCAVNEELQGIVDGCHAGPYVDASADPDDVVADLEGLLQHISGLGEALGLYNSYLSLFDAPQDDLAVLMLAEKEANGRYQLWRSVRDFLDQSRAWTEEPVLDDDGAVLLNVEAVRSEVEDYASKAYKAAKANKDDAVVVRLKELVDDFKELLPLVEELGNPALQERHWVEVFAIVGADMPPSDTGKGFAPFSIRQLLQFDLLEQLPRLQAVGATASKEAALQKALSKMGTDWQGVVLRVVEYKDTGTCVIGGTDEVQALLDDHVVKTQAMRASPFIKALEADVLAWERLLLAAQDLLDNWLTCQSTWQYLEPIFSSPDILKQMPEEGDKFNQVDTTWRDLMEAAQGNPSVLALAQDPERLARLQEANAMLEEIQKGLAAYLELKRLSFPRFFFLSNDEMLEILSETKDPTRVQPHLKKCFEGIDKLQFQANTDITGMISVEGELVPFKSRIRPAEANGAVERWLVQVEARMVEAVHDVCRQGVAAYASVPRASWVLSWPGQVVLAVSAIYWTQEVGAAMAGEPVAAADGGAVPGGKGALAAVAVRCTRQLEELVGLVRGELSNLNRATLSALVVMDVHARDVVAQLALEGIEGQPQHFSWLSQLRMYWEDAPPGADASGGGGGGKSLFVRMINAQAEYGYEYLGNSSRLVVTPLTDRCFRTLIGAVHLHMGGAPEGPAGTGKTETTKDLAKALARQCVVFNCSDTLDSSTMAKFFKGLAASGAWACFDEFNRIDLEVLSVVAQQVMEIQLAVKAKLKRFTFEGTDLPLRHSCNVFITMNPGYAGRSELPDNLKALFRSVAMMVPNYALIAEIMLFSSGYFKARECARKIVATYKLCSEQLSSQEHYDYGMRAVMAVLRAAANLKRMYPGEDEYVLMLRSIMDVNLCKFLAHDVPLFNGIISDLFPGVQLPPPDYAALSSALRSQCEAGRLQATDYFLLKATQLYEMVVVRHGLMLVGRPFSGKSSVLSVLAGALGSLADAGVKGPLFNRVQQVVINPKAVTMGQLFGECDKATQEWRDGVLAVAFRGLASDPSPDRKWLVLDGPVDTIWIENMNTVLDDNKKLCLPNSEIITMSPTMSMIFEVGDLAAASPATVSRCGMVYLEPASLGWRPLLASWLSGLPAALGSKARQHMEALFDAFLPACLRFLRRELEEMSPTEDAGVAVTAMRILESCLDDYMPRPTDSGEPGPAPAAALDEATRTQQLEGLFLFALIWSAGATCDAAGRPKFDAFLRHLAAGGCPEGYEPCLPARRPVLSVQPIPDSSSSGVVQSVYDFRFDRSRCCWVPWMDGLPAFVIPPGTHFGDIMVPTRDTVRYTHLLDLAVQHRQPLLLVGPSGTGKSSIIARHLLSGSGLPADSWVPICITLSARTTANMLQEQVDSRLDKRKKAVYGPAIGKRCVVFVDDLNMPAKEVYGAQPPLELLRQACDHGGWYGRDNVFRQMVDVQLVAAMGPPGGGRTFVTSRLLRHFNVLACAQASDDTLTSIFSTILEWHLGQQPFPARVKALGPGLVAATLALYSAASTKLLPTPAKSHYLFNLRDFARVVQGVMMLPAAALPAAAADADGSSAAAAYKRLWVHEALRVFYDRLVDGGDRDWLLGQLRGVTSKHLGAELDGLMGHLLAPGEREVGQEQLRRCFFGDFTDKEPEPSLRTYCEIPSVAAALAAVEDALADHNATSKRPLPLAVFLFALEHVARISRLMKQPGGHMLLVGVGGSGRQSLACLAAYMAGLEVFQVEISKHYGMAEWREDIKRLLRRAGVDCRPLVFLFRDSAIKHEAFVEDINNLLNAGEVPNLFPSDEKMQILEAVRPAAAKLGLESPLQLWGFFVAACKRNLHIVLCMSPIGDAFRERLRANPSLVNCCTIDWFGAWPADALEAVAMKQLREIGDLDATGRKTLVGLCQAMHVQVQAASGQFLSELGRHNYVTPTSYLELLAAFKGLLASQRSANASAHRRYSIGLEKLASSAAQVAGMQAELVAMQPQLVATVAEVEALMARIAHKKKVVVEPKAAVVREEEARAQEAAAAAKAIKDECEADLAEAIPILNDALAALDTIKEADISYIKKLTNPPHAIKLVLEAVCVVLDVKPVKGKDESGKAVNDFWKPSLTLLADRDLIGRLKSYDKDNIAPRIMSAIRATYLTDEGFTPDNAKRASPAAEGLCKWVHAMSSYDKVAKVVAPKKAKLGEAEAAYREVMVGLTAKQAELQGLLDKLASMEAELKGQQRKKEQLEADIELCSVKLERAAKLIGGLGGEKARWEDTALELSKAQVNLTGDTLIAAGVVAYLGPFTASFRARLVDGFAKLCDKAGLAHSPKFSLSSVLGDPVTIRSWLLAGLPNDAFSVDNAIIMTTARRWPLLIDPQGQANKWIKNLEKANRLQVIKLTAGGEYMRVLENAVQFGSPVLLENVGTELDPSLEPLLLKEVFKSGGVSCIALGDSTVEYSPDFRLYITTKLSNPTYLPEVSVKVSLLNFMITPAGLADQLLGVVVAAERPDLEQQKAALVLAGAENKQQLKEIEDRILQVLSASTGNILEDESAISVITEAKRLGNEVAAKQRQGEATEAAIDEARTAYAPAGHFLSTLFFCIADLASIDPMYQYSLPWFTKLVLASLGAAERPDSVAARLDAVKAHFTTSLFRNVCRSLFEKDKLLFAFVLATRVLAAQGQLEQEEWMFLLTGGLGTVKLRPNPVPWLPESSWRQLLHLAMLPAFAGIADASAADPAAWKAVFDAEQPHRKALPGMFHCLDAFRKLLVVRCLRPDKLVPAVSEFVSATLGPAFAESPTADLAGCYADSSASTPIVLVLSPGSDPTAALLQFAAAKGMASRLSAISLGQNQGPKAAALIADAAASGGWVVLQNCHLAPSWMPALDRIVEELNPEAIDPGFRLWMTSFPSPKFPVNILQAAVKLTNEPPAGLRANMRRSYALEPLASAGFLEGCAQPAPFKRLLFGLAFFHALVQERRKFGSLGWNIPYGFDDGDLRISATQLRMFLDDAAPAAAGSGSWAVPYDALRYTAGECNYGGRVTDDKDRLLLGALLGRVYSPALVAGGPGYALSPSGTYVLPEDGPRESYLAAIDSLPAAQLPEVFGLHANAAITKELGDTSTLLGSLLALSGGSGGSGGAAEAAAVEARVGGLVEDVLARLPAPFDTEAVAARFPLSYGQSLNTVLVQEMGRYNRLTRAMADSLRGIRCALHGLSVMSSELEAAVRSISLNQVPELWKRLSYPSLRPLGSYLADLIRRLEMLASWAAAGAPPPAFWLPGFFFVQSFLTAGLQNYVRKHGLPIDEVDYDYEMLGMEAAAYEAGLAPPPQEGLYVHGLLLEGAGWDAGARRLAESAPGALFAPAPVMWFRPRHVKDAASAGGSSSCYSCPLYRTADRRGVLATTGHSTNFVQWVSLPSDAPASHWTLRGVALLMEAAPM